MNLNQLLHMTEQWIGVLGFLALIIGIIVALIYGLKPDKALKQDILNEKKLFRQQALQFLEESLSHWGITSINQPESQPPDLKTHINKFYNLFLKKRKLFKHDEAKKFTAYLHLVNTLAKATAAKNIEQVSVISARLQSEINTLKNEVE